MPAIIPTRNVSMKRFMTNPEEKLNESCFDERVLNHGRMNHTTIRATMVAAKV